MAADTSRFPQGVWITVTSLATAMPVGAVVLFSGALYVSTDAVTPTYTQLTGSAAIADVLDGTFRIDNTADPTKKIAFSAASVTAGATRTMTAPDRNWNMNQQGLIQPNVITDPGTAQAIPVTASGFLGLTIGSAGAETNTLALFPQVGQTMTIRANSVGTGTRAITAAGPLDQVGNTIMTFNAAGDSITLMCFGPGFIIIQNESVALS